MSKVDAYTFLKNYYCTCVVKKNLIDTIWKFYNKDSILVVLHNEKGIIKSGDKKYKINRWYVSNPTFERIKNIVTFIKQNKQCLLKMNRIVNDNILIKEQLDKIFKQIYRFQYNNIFGWKIGDHFSLHLDLYKSCFDNSIYIKMDNTFSQPGESYTDYKTMLQILRSIDIKHYINNYIKLNESQQAIQKLEETLNNTILKDTKYEIIKEPTSKQEIYNEIKYKYPNLFVKMPIKKRLEIQSCKNFWDFINFEQKVD